jgi:phage protein D
VTPAENAAEMRVLGPPTADPAELRALAQAVRDEAAWVLGATGEVNAEAYGAVLLPHRTVLVKGAGKPYSGAYYVVRVVHELTGAGDWTQRFEALRNARDVTGDEAFAGPAGGLALPGLP